MTAKYKQRAEVVGAKGKAMAGHININMDSGNIRYEYPRNLPILFSGTITADKFEKWIEEKRERVTFIGVMGEKLEMQFSNLEQVKAAQKRLLEMAGDLGFVLANYEGAGGSGDNK